MLHWVQAWILQFPQLHLSVNKWTKRSCSGFYILRFWDDKYKLICSHGPVSSHQSTWGGLMCSHVSWCWNWACLCHPCVCVCVCVCVYKNTHSSPVCFIINMAAPSGLPHLHWFCHNWWGLHVTAQPFSASLTFLSLYFISQISTTPPPVALFVTLSPDLTSSPRLSVLHINPHQLITEAGMLVNSVESENITTELKEFSEDELLITFGEPPHDRQSHQLEAFTGPKSNKDWWKTFSKQTCMNSFTGKET